MADLKASFEASEAKKKKGKASVRSTTKASSKRAKNTSAAPAPVASPTDIAKKELIERVTAKSGLKRGVAKQGLEATLSVLADLLTEERKISAAPLGNIRVVKTKQTANGTLSVVRVKMKDLDTSEAGASSDTSETVPS